MSFMPSTRGRLSQYLVNRYISSGVAFIGGFQSLHEIGTVTIATLREGLSKSRVALPDQLAQYSQIKVNL